jgi:hypothetical protein
MRISLTAGKIFLPVAKTTLSAYKMRCLSVAWVDFPNPPAAEFLYL